MDIQADTYNASFSDAQCALLEERRRCERTRIKKKFITQMTPWAAGHASTPVEVIIEDLSDTGAGIIHDQPLEIGLRHLLAVPRKGTTRPVVLEYVVVRCEPRGVEKFTIGLQLADRAPTTPSAAPTRRRVTSKRLKLLFLLFGIVGLLVATFAPL